MNEIELKTGPLEPGRVLELALLTVDQLNQLKLHPNLSVNQRKKCEKRIKWLLAAPQRREKRRAKRADGKGEKSSRLRTYETIARSDNFDEHIHIALDFGHGAPCNLLEWKDMTKQTRRCYQHYRRSKRAFQLHLLDIRHSENFIKMLEIHAVGWEKWDLHMNESIEDIKESAVYLTAEAEETLETVVPGQVYVIGGLVDRNRLPGVCSARAKKLGLKEYRLPIAEHVEFKSRTVLTVNHVFEILIERMNGADWRSALLSVLPQRKIKV